MIGSAHLACSVRHAAQAARRPDHPHPRRSASRPLPRSGRGFLYFVKVSSALLTSFASSPSAGSVAQQLGPVRAAPRRACHRAPPARRDTTAPPADPVARRHLVQQLQRPRRQRVARLQLRNQRVELLQLDARHHPASASPHARTHPPPCRAVRAPHRNGPTATSPPHRQARSAAARQAAPPCSGSSACARPPASARRRPSDPGSDRRRLADRHVLWPGRLLLRLRRSLRQRRRRQAALPWPPRQRRAAIDLRIGESSGMSAANAVQRSIARCSSPACSSPSAR